MEPRFGFDFSRVRLHTDRKAADSARAVNAQAYTIGRDVVFGSGKYPLHGNEGKRLVAHELTHVVQQGDRIPLGCSFRANLENNAAEVEADAVAQRALSGRANIAPSIKIGPGLQRRVRLDQPRNNIPNPGGGGLVQTNATTINNYLTTICSGGSVATDAGSGVVSMNRAFCTAPALAPGEYGPPAPSGAQRSREPTGCGCLCDLVSSPHLWTIEVNDADWPHTDFDDNDAANGLTPGGTGGTVTAPSPNSPKLWGAATVTGRALNIDPWLVLGHELCGHAWLGNSGSHGPDVASRRGEGGHQLTVQRENALRAEHGIELRGTHRDPNCGESFWRDRARPGRVNWSVFRAVCQSWRAAYNRRHGTRYRISDRIP